MARISAYRGFKIHTTVKVFREGKRTFRGCVRIGKDPYELRPYSTARMTAKEVYACGKGSNPRAALAAGLRKAAVKMKAVRRGHFRGVR